MLGHSDRVREVPFLQFEWLSVSQKAESSIRVVWQVPQFLALPLDDAIFYFLQRR